MIKNISRKHLFNLIKKNENLHNSLTICEQQLNHIELSFLRKPRRLEINISKRVRQAIPDVALFTAVCLTAT